MIIVINKRVNIFGVILFLFILTGCLLPWEYTGGFIAYPIYSITLEPLFTDNGGVLIILLSIIEMGILTINYKGNTFKYIKSLLLIPGIIIFTSSIIRVIHFYKVINVILISEPPSLGIGIYIVLFGSFLFLIIIGRYVLLKVKTPNNGV